MKKRFILLLVMALIIFLLSISVLYFFLSLKSGESKTNEHQINPQTSLNSLPKKNLTNGSEPLTRYPGSVMLEYHKRIENIDISLPEEILEIPKREVIIIDYGTNEDSKNVSDWYMKTLSKWKLLDFNESKYDITMDARKGCHYIFVQIFKPNPPASNYVRIHMEYINNILPSNDLDSGHEIIERYPNSIILKAETDPDIGQDIIYYLTCSEEDEVFNWYLQTLQESGWSIVSMDRGEYMIDEARKGNQLIAIDIERPAKDVPLQVHVYPLS